MYLWLTSLAIDRVFVVVVVVITAYQIANIPITFVDSVFFLSSIDSANLKCKNKYKYKKEINWLHSKLKIVHLEIIAIYFSRADYNLCMVKIINDFLKTVA